MSIKDVLKETEEKMKQASVAVRREFAEVRTGRANPQLVEGLHADYYGTPTPIKQIASISVPDARLIVIQPWDKAAIEGIEKAILKSNLGVTPSVADALIRISFPSLSDERRQELAKVVKDMAENGRVSLRTIRRGAIEVVRKLESDGKISEDERFRAQEEIQKLIDKYIKNVEEVLTNKEKELTEF